MTIRKIVRLAALGILLASGFEFSSAANAGTRVVVGMTGNLSRNPYIDSDALNYTNGCQTYGCLGYYDAEVGDIVPMLAESWETTDPTTWIFHLRKDAKWQNGDPVTAADIVHSQWRRMNDPQSKQQANGKDVKTIEAVDDHTVRVTTATANANLLFLMTDRLTITNKKIYDQYGAEVADRDHTVGFGPYKIAQVVPGQRVIMEKVPDNVFAVANSPDQLIFQVMKEDEQRVTALLNGEIQIALGIPPHMVDRIKSSGKGSVAVGNSVEVYFLGMNPTVKPWDNKALRQAVNYAIDKDTIIETVLGGFADRLDGPIGEGQYAYDPNLTPKYTYDPEKAKALVKEAGFPNGVNVDFYVSQNNYVNDKQTTAAIAAMLKAVGINAELKPLETAKMFDDMSNGRLSFYNFARGSVFDPSPMLSQFFETGVTKRIMYSNPTLDSLLVKERSTLNPVERKKVLNEAMSIVNDDAPAAFLWRVKLVVGTAKNVSFVPHGTLGVIGNDIVLK